MSNHSFVVCVNKSEQYHVNDRTKTKEQGGEKERDLGYCLIRHCFYAFPLVIGSAVEQIFNMYLYCRMHT